MQRFVKLSAALAAVCGALCAPGALGGGELPSGFNVDVDAGFPFIADVPSAGYGAASGQVGSWDVVAHTSSAPEYLKNINNQVTAVLLTKGPTSQDVNSQCIAGVGTQDYFDLMCDYAYEVVGVPAPIEYTISGLPAGSYQFYTYSCITGPMNPASNTLVNITVGSTNFGNQIISGADVPNQTFAQGLTHTVHTITVGAGQDLVLTVFDSSGEFGDPIALNGFQIIPTGKAFAEITTPEFLTCGCQPVAITGTAAAEGSDDILSWELEWSMDGNDPWTTIATGSSDVNNGLLANWNTGALAEGYYVVRLTAISLGGQSSTAFTTVYLDRDFDDLLISGPTDGGVYGGSLCAGGTFWDNCFLSYKVERRAQGTAAWIPFDPLFPSYSTAIINQTGAVWNTLLVADGEYEVRISGMTECGNTQTVSNIFVLVDNTAPIVKITSPEPCDGVGCVDVPVTGTVIDKNLAGWTLQYTANGMPWTTIASGSNEVEDGLLGTLVNADPSCAYTFRLVAGDKAAVNCTGLINNSAETLVTVTAGLAGDINGDGFVDSQDLNILLGDFGTQCE